MTNFDASALWIRERRQLIDALDVTPEFLRTKEGDAGARDHEGEYDSDLNLTRPRYRGRLQKLAFVAWEAFPVSQALVRTAQFWC